MVIFLMVVLFSTEYIVIKQNKFKHTRRMQLVRFKSVSQSKTNSNHFYYTL